MSNNSQIGEFFKNQTIFLTEGTDLIGKLLVEKLLRTADLKKIYILMRAKREKKFAERFDDFFHNACFKNINRNDFESKVSVIGGDCKKLGLGLNSKDVDILKKETTCIIHAAANVNLRQTIKEASYNVVSTNEMIKLAERMENLKIFVYVSTSFTNCFNSHIREEIYQTPIKAEAFLDLVDSCNEDEVEKTLLPYLNKWPNNYAFSKCLSEALIKDSGMDIPTTIVRPSSVTNAMKHPVPGWVDNYHSIVGIVAGGFLGILQNLYAKKEKKVHFVPADFVCNCILAVAWDTANSKNLTVINCVGEPIVYERLVSKIDSLYWKFPSVKCLWFPKMTIIQNKCWYNVKGYWMLMLAYCIDLILFCSKQQVGASKMRKQIAEQVSVLSYFTVREWNFDDDRFMNLWKKMGDEDKKIFPFYVNTMDWNKYLSNCILGIRLLFKDPISTLPHAKAKFKIMSSFYYTIVALFYYFLYIMFYKFLTK
ncbi:hypothetical protein Zmor_028214 [Zophobas morio]|uniref:Fatty acyl-CoA reductase n=1 Tax=Zophobas morio TaxID=2755281 RepID=A0AA38HPX7_9CUCU|nr:hypothetical protein Zmor_028214 [Zophobas morio]